ncbi:MAG TPA: ABC transporter permease [Rhodanobacteraceae bacterium]
MFAYYLALALRSFRRNKLLTALMVLTIGFGVAASMTTWSVFRAVSGDPIPQKSSELFVPQIDNWGPTGSADGKNREPPNALDYTDAAALMRAHRAKYQSPAYEIIDTMVPTRPGQHPLITMGQAVSNEFFPMVDTPFQYGTGWSAADETDRAHVIVISHELNDELFGGGNSVGKTLTMNEQEFRVVGVLDHWNPQPVFFNIWDTGGFTGFPGADFFIPFTTAIATGSAPEARVSCNGSAPAKPGFAGIRESSCVWIAFLVQLDGSATVRRYRQFLTNYAAAQQQAGRFHWAPNVRLRGLMAWLRYRHVAPSNVGISMYVALGLLIACLINTSGLMLAKFLRRSAEIGTRRALGASRHQIYAQFMVEAGMVGVAGGVLGLVLTSLGVASLRWVLPANIVALAHFNVSLLITTVVVAIVATLLAGLYPVLRAAAIQPALQIKSN